MRASLALLRARCERPWPPCRRELDNSRLIASSGLGPGVVLGRVDGRPTNVTLGQKQTFAMQYVMSALPPKADMCGAH